MTQPIKIRMGGYGPPTTGFSKSLKLIGDKLEAQFGEGVAIEYVYNIMDHGHKAEDILTMVEDGSITLGYQSSSYLTDRVPELGFVDLPFLFSSNAQARVAMDGELGAFLVRKMEERINYRILGWFENGFRHISNRLRPIHLPADMKGMKIRVLPSDIQKPCSFYLASGAREVTTTKPKNHLHRFLYKTYAKGCEVAIHLQLVFQSNNMMLILLTHAVECLMNFLFYIFRNKEVLVCSLLDLCQSMLHGVLLFVSRRIPRVALPPSLVIDFINGRLGDI